MSETRLSEAERDVLIEAAHPSRPDREELLTAAVEAILTARLSAASPRGVEACHIFGEHPIGAHAEYVRAWDAGALRAAPELGENGQAWLQRNNPYRAALSGDPGPEGAS